MVKVAYFVSNICQCGGVENKVCKTASFLADKYKYDVAIYSLHSSEKTPVYFNLSPKVTVIHLNEDFTAENIFRLIKIMNVILRKNDIDIFITLHNRTSIAALANKFFFKGKIVAEEHQAHYSYTQKGILINKLFLRFVDKFILLSEYNRSYYKKLGFNNTEVIPNSIERTDDRTADLHSKTMIAVGRLDYVKGFDMLLDAFAVVNKKYPDWKLVILGDGEERCNLEQRIKNLNLERNAELIGFVNNVDDYLMKSSVFILSSRSEGQPLALLEAMNRGLACCAFDIPAVKNLMDSQSECMVPSNDVDGLAIALLGLAASYEKRKLFSDAAKKTVQKYYINTVMKEWQELFESLCFDK